MRTTRARPSSRRRSAPEENAFSHVAAQALLGLAAVLVVAKQPEAAIRNYARVGDPAEAAGMPILSIEA